MNFLLQFSKKYQEKYIHNSPYRKYTKNENHGF